MDDCIFCKIVKKEITSEILYEDDQILAFKDVNPAAPVHVLVIPKSHITSAMELTVEHKDLITQLFFVAQKMAKELGVDGEGFRLVNNCGEDGGQTVNHLHIHLLAGRGLSWPPG